MKILRSSIACLVLGSVLPLTTGHVLVPQSVAADADLRTGGDMQSETPLSINAIMRRAMTQGLCQSVIKGRASDDEVKELLHLFRELKRNAPPLGSSEKWRGITDRLISATEGIAAGKSTHNDLRAAANCVNCHREHRPATKSGG